MSTGRLTYQMPRMPRTETRIACQTYTWQMSGNYVGRLDHILSLLGRTGFAGVEPETQYLGRLAEPAAMARALAESSVGLAAEMQLVSRQAREWAQSVRSAVKSGCISASSSAGGWSLSHVVLSRSSEPGTYLYCTAISRMSEGGCRVGRAAT